MRGSFASRLGMNPTPGRLQCGHVTPLCPPAPRPRARGVHLLLTGTLLLAAALPAALAQRLPAPVADALQRANLPADALAAAVLPVSPPRLFSPRWLHQADRPMPPASTMKLLTSMVALDTLGPNLRGHTELWTRAPVQPGATPADGGVLQGDLVIRGGADPELGLAQLWALMAELRWQGIQQIAGDIVLDRQLFRPARPDLGLPPFDEAPEFPYNMVPDALQLGGNLMGLEIRSDGQQVLATARPPLPDLVIDASALRLTDRACRDWDDDWASPPQVVTQPGGVLRVVLQGGFPRDCQQRPYLQLIDRNALAERQLRWVWQSLGGQWAGQVREADQPLLPPPRPLPAPLANLLPAGAPALPAPGVSSAVSPMGIAEPPAPRLLARRDSRPWGELLRTLNKQSDNMLTRLLYLQLGVNAMAAHPDQATAALAERAVRQWLAERRIPATGLVVDNGSGLSRTERIMPRTLALALQAAYHARWAPELVMSLPLAGVDGTMRNRLRSSPAGGWARLKTGTLRDTTALAGYVRDDRGRWWVLSAMLNHERAAAGRPVLDALVDWVASGGMSARASGPAGHP
jgi:serine-type D-Ala-D-Ala carboxypeptidase/endopeptidase (penicillin-binding protein 4)